MAAVIVIAKNQTSFNGWMTKQNVVHPLCGILFSKKKEPTTGVTNNLMDFQGIAPSEKSPVPESYNMSDPTYMSFMK